MIQLLGLALGTLISEDLACVTAGLLIQRADVSASAGIAACVVGILLGDWGLWAIGRFGGAAVLSSPWLARRVTAAGVAEAQAWLSSRGPAAIMISRFLPGTRLPVYVVAGIAGMPGRRFALWTLVASVLWTPAIVLAAAGSGDVAGARAPLPPILGWLQGIAAAGVLLLVIRGTQRVARGDVRRQLAARLARWRRWEFWPAWLFYIPVTGWVVVLALRYRGLRTITASNPAIADGGVVGESKFDIQTRLPVEWAIQSALVESGALERRVAQALERMAVAGWTFPVILKPDVGQRGAGVRLVHDVEGLRAYLTDVPGAAMVQPYHEGPFEAGIFYYRMPHWARGRILSVTDKVFPTVVGDGRSTVEDLIWRHPRCRLQAALFLRRHRKKLKRVLGRGEVFQLAVAGNHAQGTTFRDGAHLITRELEQRIDDIARALPGFFVGRFDVRYRNVEDFKNGRDLAIVELNGATAESTNIYDPDGSLGDAYRQLFRQWKIVFQIGAENRARGAAVTSASRMAALLRTYLTTPLPHRLSD